MTSSYAALTGGLPTADNDNQRGGYRYRQRLAYPALRWLIKYDPEAALAVFHHIRNVSCTYGEHAPSPSYFDPREYSANDAETHEAPRKPWASLDDMIASGDGIDGANLDRLHEVRPELHELLRSAGGIAWPWCGVRRKRDGKIRWFGEPWAYQWTEVQRRADPNRRGVHIITLGGLTYYTRPATEENPVRRRHPGGMLVTYADDTGRLQRPAYRATKPRGGKTRTALPRRLTFICLILPRCRHRWQLTGYGRRCPANRLLVISTIRLAGGNRVHSWTGSPAR